MGHRAQASPAYLTPHFFENRCSFVQILKVSTAFGVEFETAAIRVDFLEIEAVKKTVEKWQKV
ncbi:MULTISPECIES: hypothetical protein [unclassified Microcoleus]|uniref:hypothetical protein n=1 Tax=unclassified Microcoleus TaxID=2642155 RepID=UPI0025FC0687|nr:MULTISPECIES: hypothetical protein [unclassified Microcoleus]